MPEFNFWTPKQVADELGLSSGYVVELINGKSPNLDLPATKVGKQWLIADKDAREFIEKYRSSEKEFYSPGELAKAIGKSRPYIINALTGYGGRREPSLKAEKQNNRWIISKEEAERFISLHTQS